MADYSTYGKAELLKVIASQEKELKAKKYGLVWDAEREPEQVVLDCAHNLPILKRIKSKAIKTDDSEDNILIEGDNYHALTVLNYTHKEKISVLNDRLFNQSIITKVEYVENRLYLTIGNNAAHGEYEDYDLKQVEKFYQHIQSLLNSYNI